MQITRSRFLLTLLCAVASLSVFSPTSHAQTLQIDPIKANYLDGFLNFVRWEGQLKTDTATIGVIGNRELFNHLQAIAAAKTNGRPLRVVLLQPGDDLSGLSVLYLAPGHRAHWQAIGDACRAHRVLLVGDEEDLARAHGAIEFVIRKNRLRFRLNLENARKCGVEISSKLAEMAVDPT